MKRFTAGLLLVCIAGISAVAAATPADEMVFDRNKGGLYAIYGRALRDNPKLEGSVTVRITIAESGSVTDCRVLSSELGAPDVENRLCQRIRQMIFAPRSAPTSIDKRIDFFPAA